MALDLSMTSKVRIAALISSALISSVALANRGGDQVYASPAEGLEFQPYNAPTLEAPATPAHPTRRTIVRQQNLALSTGQLGAVAPNGGRYTIGHPMTRGSRTPSYTPAINYQSAPIVYNGRPQTPTEFNNYTYAGGTGVTYTGGRSMIPTSSAGYSPSFGGGGGGGNGGYGRSAPFYQAPDTEAWYDQNNRGVPCPTCGKSIYRNPGRMARLDTSDDTVAGLNTKGMGAPLSYAAHLQRFMSLGLIHRRYPPCAEAVRNILVGAGLLPRSAGGGDAKYFARVLKQNGFHNDPSACNRPGVVRVYDGVYSEGQIEGFCSSNPGNPWCAPGRDRQTALCHNNGESVGDCVGHTEIYGTDGYYHSFAAKAVPAFGYPTSSASCGSNSHCRPLDRGDGYAGCYVKGGG